MSMSTLDIEVGVDLASAFLFFAMFGPALENDDPPPPDTFILLTALLAPVSITDVGPADDAALLFGMLAGVGPAVDPVLDGAPPPVPLLLLVVVLLLVPNTESELTTIVSVKFDVVNLAMASFDRRSLLLPV